MLLCSPEAYSCSCADPSAREKFRSADLVFVGQAVDYNEAPSNDHAINYIVTFKVEKRWKGPKGSEITLAWMFDSPGMCNDLPLVKGERYLIYSGRQTVNYKGHKKEELIVETDCGPNHLAKYHEKEIRKLNDFWFRMFARMYPFPKF